MGRLLCSCTREAPATCASKIFIFAISPCGNRLSLTRPRLFCCDQYPIPLPADHKFPASKYRMLRDMLSADGVVSLEPAEFAPSDQLELAHDPAYVEGFLHGTLDPAVM